MKIANINYIHHLYYPLISMTDEEISKFEINNRKDRYRLFRLMSALLKTFGPIAAENISDCLEYVIFTRSYENYWRDLIPHEIPLDDVDDKEEYINELFFALFQRPPLRQESGSITISQQVPPQGLKTNE